MSFISLFLSLSVFVSELMSQMTLEEKIGQLNLPVAPSEIVTGETTSENILSLIRNGQAGAVFNATGYETVYELQRIAVEETRLGIPLLFGLDVIHGYKTCFPVPLGMSSSWNMELVEKMSRISAIEASADGINWLYGPMVDVSRDPRWGRCVEGPGEDPYFNGQYAVASVKGIQGELKDDSEILACAKHFALYGASESGMDYRETDMSLERMYNVYLEPYKYAVDAGVKTIMGSFNDINGVPASANEYLLKEVLRDYWGFDGFVVSDYNAVSELTKHGLGDAYEVSKRAIDAGMDMDMVCAFYVKNIAQAVQNGDISEEVIDDACRRILEIKCELGLFDDPYRFIKKGAAAQKIGTKEAEELAYESAVESFVLLKNDGVLPLKKGSKVAFVGPFVDAGAQYAGSWSAKTPKELASILDVLKSRSDIEYLYAQGSNILDDAQLEKATTFRRPYKRDSRSNEAMLKEALKVARRSDVVVACLGEGAYMTGESNSRTSLDLPDCQRELLRKLVDTGKPVVLVLFSGRPMTLSWENERVSAILDVWYGGTRTADAVLDVLKGDVNPSGKLTMTFPRNVGQIPIYYAYKPSGRPNKFDDGFNRFRSSWIDSPTSPLYPFGYGLSYTTFEYSDVRLSSDKMSMDGSVKASVVVKNTGSRDGKEIVQLYIHDKVSSMTRPVKELRGFQKVFIPSGDSSVVTFDITPDMLSWYYVDQYNMSRKPAPISAEKSLEPGEFEIMIVPNSAHAHSAVLEVVRPRVKVKEFGALSSGEMTHLYALTNSSGSKMSLCDYGARIVSIKVPDRNGYMDDVVVGYGDIASFETKDRFMGCTIGRYANRIDNASFFLDGHNYVLDANEHFRGAPVQCHGGKEGFDRFIWDSEVLETPDSVGVRFHRLSPDGEGGFPGNCDCYVTFWWTEDNVCRIVYEATTDKSTVVCMSNHTYFNLKGSEPSYVMDHLLRVNSDTCIQNNTHFCPDLVLSVEGTPFDFREPHRVDYRLDKPSKQLEIMHGMSACWAIRDYDGTLRCASDLYDAGSGRGVQTWTTEPALLTYTARLHNEKMIGKYGPLQKYGAMLLETIHFPDSPNQSRFPSAVLRPGEKYRSVTEWRFYKK